MRIEYTPQGVCSRKMFIEVDENDIVTDLEVIGGCNGNLKGISSLVKGMKNKGKKIDVFKMHNGNQEAYSYSKREYELCSNCTKELEIFLRGERQ